MGIKFKLRKIHNAVAVLLLAVLGVGGYVVWLNQKDIPAPVLTEKQMADQGVIDKWYAPLVPMMVDNIKVEASVADTTEARTRGLSGTPYLPEGVVKLFVFEDSQEWGFWMKDMNYSIDIIWVDEIGKIVDFEEDVSPATYPMSFVPSRPAKYVVETRAGFIKRHSIELGDIVVLPNNN